jgi:transposase InsO family protein
VRRTQRRTLDPQRLQQAVDLRLERCTLRRIAGVLSVPLATVGRLMKGLGLGRLKNLDPKPPVRRYQWERPGDMIHFDTKQLARFERVGHRITGDRRQGSSRGAGYEKVHVAIDDSTRLANVEVLADEQKATTIGFLARAVGWFSEQGITCRRILSDNGSAYRSGDWRKACRALDLRPIRTKPYTPQPMARPSGSSRRSWRNGLTPSPTRHQRNATAGYPAIWGSITATGATWPSVASRP